MDDNYDNRNRVVDTAKEIAKAKVKRAVIAKVLAVLGPVGFIFLFIIIPVIMVGMILIIVVGASDGTSSGYSSSNLYYAYESCESIKVEGYDGILSLEEYVMGVVSDEAYTSEGMEALKAQAIAARTYAIMRTNYCQNTIRNSSQDQNFTTNIKENARIAVEETQGLVLTYNGSLFTSEYDSFYKGDDYSCNGSTCKVTYEKLPTRETHVVEIPVSWENMMAGGHGRGMSQIASYELANLGYNYEEILKYFYSDGTQITKLTPLYSGIVGNNYSPYFVRSKAPTSDVKYYNEPYVRNRNRGQCVWYVKGRASEIISTAVKDEDTLNLALSAINNTTGNGRDWWNNSSLSVFGSSNNYRQPQAGSIIVWEYTSKKIAEKNGNNWGHVAIIESISLDGKVSISEGWATNTQSCPNNWNCVRFNYQTFDTIEDFYNWVLNYDGEGGYRFLGYVYLLG